jgi:hypothetical protein
MAYFIIETKEQLSNLPKVDKCFIDLISLSEENHPSLTSPCVLYYNDFSKGYIIPINHEEGFSVSMEDIQFIIQNCSTAYLFDKKWHSYFLNLPENTIDVYFTMLDISGTIPNNMDCHTNIHSDFYNRFKYLENVNAIIPISKHYERCECMFELIRQYIGKESNLAWQNSYTEAYKWVEEQGIKVNDKLFDKYFEPTWKARSIKDGRIYTKYNLYNITSRPTNAFNGINFLAFTKDNHSRAAFIPENDTFVEFDFDGYHLRLVANMLGVNLSTETSIHVTLGREYFGKEELTPEEYQESKKITFRQMYNGVEDEVKHIELFKEIDVFIAEMWKKYQENGYVELPNGRKLIQDKPNPQKLFNYYIQCLETVNNTKKLIKLKELLQNRKSKVILVVYDSILIDFAKEDGRELLTQIKAVLEEDNYVVKAQIGNNYDFNS